MLRSEAVREGLQIFYLNGKIKSDLMKWHKPVERMQEISAAEGRRSLGRPSEEMRTVTVRCLIRGAKLIVMYT